MINEQTIKQRVSADQFGKYEKFKENYRVSIDRDLRYCPFPDCNTVIDVHSKREKAGCPTCGKVMCILCNRPDHPLLTCGELLEKDVEALTKDKLIQKCEICSALVEKNEGCNHITWYGGGGGG